MNEVVEIRHLRIGNILSYDNRIVHVTSLSIDIDDEYEDQIGFCNYGEVSHEKGGWNRSLCDKLSPIPLTPEWLQRCGLKDKAGNKMGYRMDINYSDELCWYVQDGLLRYQTQRSGFTRQLRHIQYVHQLQNWYYSFTGEELQIKL